ncbi:sensor histidine kinase [Rhodococcus chondri]|uniref:histidine kinase n=1 Tax=Rhodococcus chondri TaxID=3065941 RepID=A0ABU7JWF1_9NOCA|nr:ATP-binding protein [Rhodococcus sp. CC-R104]MEE2034358.1 CHASE3 domain-containing protein [Rhodococcus sp. CC-R104]
MRNPSLPEPRSERVRSRMTVQGWFQVAFAALALFVVIGTVIGAYFIERTVRITNELVETIQPAHIEAYRLQSALLDQEIGVRSYALTADPALLEPYLSGRQIEQDATQQLRRLIGGRQESIAQLDAITVTAQNWRADYAEPLVAAAAPDEPLRIDLPGVERDGAAFGELRAQLEEQNAILVQARTDGYDELVHARTLRNSVLVAMVVGFLLTGVLMVVLVHNLVATPLLRLRAATRRVVAGGNFDQHIYPQGPKDIRALAADVEAMREHIARALTESRRQQDRLAQQAVDLDAQADELRRSNSELEQFAYVASHDLQEPLRKVASFCQLLEKRYGDQLDERGVQYIAYAVDGAKRMQGLINDLLAFSRVGRVNDAQVRVDLGHTLDKALNNLSVAIDESQVRIERPENLPELTGDPTLLTMLWQNLLANAIKFHDPERAPVVQITCERVDGGEDPAARSWQFCVSDNGIGIAPEFAEKVFVIFQRLHGRDEYSGTGIGLALCRKIVDYHGGNIWVDTDYTEGARVCFTLTSTVPEAESISPMPAPREVHP